MTSPIITGATADSVSIATKLLELAARCEQATGPNQNLDAVIHTKAFGFEPRRAGVGWPDENAPVVPAFPGWVPLPAYTASLDAAMTLVPEGFPFDLSTNYVKPFAVIWTSEEQDWCPQGEADTLALALCAAALRARAAQ